VLTVKKLSEDAEKVLQLAVMTSNLSKAHVTRDSSGLATWAIVYSMQ